MAVPDDAPGPAKRNPAPAPTDGPPDGGLPPRFLQGGVLAWLRRLPYGGSGRLRSYEQAALLAWRSSLSPEALRRADAQLQCFFMLQRLSADKLVGFFAGRWIGALSEEMRFRYRGDGAVARVRMRSTGRDGSRRQRCDVDVKVYEGRLLSLEFTRPPTVLRDGSEVLGVDVEIDPMMENRFAGTPGIPDVAFPEDHEEVIDGRTESFANGGWTVLPPGAVWRLVLPRDNFVVLAEREESAGGESARLCLRESDGALVFLDDHGELVAEAGGTFRGALAEDPPPIDESV